MGEIAKYGMTPWGGDGLGGILRQVATNWTPNTLAMATYSEGTNIVPGWAARFMAPVAKAVSGFRIYWSSVTTPSNVTARLEGITSDGKPDGTVIDAAGENRYSVTFTPSAGAQLVSFSPTPTTALTVGTTYAIVLLTTGSSSALTLRSYWSGTGTPQSAMVATDARTRSNFSEATGGACPVCAIVFSDGTEESCGMVPFYESASGTNSSRTLYGASRRAGALIEVLTTTTVRGCQVAVSKIGSGTPGNLVVKLLDKDGATVTGTEKTFSPGLWPSGGGLRYLRCLFTETVSLTAESSPYRLVLDSPDSTGATNCFTAYGAKAFGAKFVPSSHQWCWYDGSWHDEPTIQPIAELLLDTITVSGSGGSNLLRPACSLGSVNG